MQQDSIDSQTVVRRQNGKLVVKYPTGVPVGKYYLWTLIAAIALLGGGFCLGYPPFWPLLAAFCLTLFMFWFIRRYRFIGIVFDPNGFQWHLGEQRSRYLFDPEKPPYFELREDEDGEPEPILVIPCQPVSPEEDDEPVELGFDTEEKAKWILSEIETFRHECQQ